MKKKFSLEIKNLCFENFDKMTPNSQGLFCNSCAKNVIDLGTKTTSEVAIFISKNKNQSICARLKTSQLEQEFEINETSKINKIKYTIAVAALVLLSSNVDGQEKTLVPTEENNVKPNYFILGKISFVKPESKTISFTLYAKLLNALTKKPLSVKDYPTCTIYINGALQEVTVNAKTGDFTVALTIDKGVKQLNITITSDNLHLSKTIQINTSSIKNDILNQTILIKPKEFENYQIIGGLGVNYIATKKSNRLT